MNCECSIVGDQWKGKMLSFPVLAGVLLGNDRFHQVCVHLRHLRSDFSSDSGIEAFECRSRNLAQNLVSKGVAKTLGHKDCALSNVQPRMGANSRE